MSSVRFGIGYPLEKTEAVVGSNAQETPRPDRRQRDASPRHHRLVRTQVPGRRCVQMPLLPALPAAARRLRTADTPGRKAGAPLVPLPPKCLCGVQCQRLFFPGVRDHFGGPLGLAFVLGGPRVPLATGGRVLGEKGVPVGRTVHH